MTGQTTTPPEIAALVKGLTPEGRADFTTHWDEFCDADPLSNGRDIDAYLRDMEVGGFIMFVPVDDDALDDPFAYERGIEPDGMMWTMTDLGQQVRAALKESSDAE